MRIGECSLEIIPCIARSSGLLSRTRLRVRFPQSLLLTRLALIKSQPLDLEFVYVSVSIILSWPLKNDMGDGISGVETAPKLEMESGESSEECLSLTPMVAD